MPGARLFIDSTTFLYTLDRFELEKSPLAQAWLNSLASATCGITNLQVLNEVASVITRKIERFGQDDPFFRVDAFAGFGSTPLSPECALAARALFPAYRYSWWDCLLLASALELGCTHFLSEDLSDGQTITDSAGRSLTIVDPFTHSPDTILS